MVDAWEAVLTRWENYIEDAVMAYLERQRSVIIARLLGVKTRKAVLEKGRPLEAKTVVDEFLWREELRSTLFTTYLEIYATVGADILDKIEPGAIFDAQHPSAVTDVNLLVLHAMETEGFEERIVAKLEKIRDGIRKKSELEELAELLTEEYSAGARNFANRLARSTSAGAVNGASYAGATQSTNTRRKLWIDVSDNKVRGSHKHVSGGEAIPTVDYFTLNSGSIARYPNDPTLPTREWINCRCSVIYVTGPNPLAEAGEALASLFNLA